MHLAGWTRLLEISHIPLTVLLSTLYHDKLNLIDLLSVIISDSLDHLALLKVPNDQSSIFGARCHVPIALADGNVYDHVHVTVQGRLQHQVVFPPYLDYAILEN